jgi:hypothetical protein
MFNIEDRQSVVAILAKLYDFTEGPRARRVLIEQAGLRRFVPAIDLAGTPTTVAGDLVGKLELFGRLEERPTHHALGALLAYVLTLSDVPHDDARVLARLVLAYRLVGDAAYLETLAARYDVHVAAVASAAPAAVVQVPVPATAPSAAPAFAPHIDDEPALERVINSEDNFLDIHLLVGAIYSAAAVCRIENPPGTALGTGFLIGADLLITNQHVLKSKDWLEGAIARFDHRLDGTATAAPGREIAVRGDFYESSAAEEYDYALVRLASAPL